MIRAHLICIEIGLLIIGLLACRPKNPPSDRMSVQHVTLNQTEYGFAGRLEIWLDQRLDQKTRDSMWGAGPWDMVLEGIDPRYKAFAKKEPVPAELRLLDGSGKVVQTLRFEHPLARLETARLIRGKSTVLISEDYSIGMGSYAGPLTRLLDVHTGRIEWLKAYDPEHHKTETIGLSRTLKYDWQLTPNHSGGQDILQITCSPFQAPISDTEEQEFIITYSRYHFDGRQWIVRERQEKGFWENEGDFPPASAFPKTQ